MTKMAPKSSTMARAAKNILIEVGTRLPNAATMAKAKAMSVAMGMPQPCWLGFPELKSKKMAAGTNMPPNAANTGIAAFLMEESSPSINSRLISKPTTKKKMAIKPSLIQVVVL